MMSFFPLQNWKHTVWYKMNGIALVLSWILVRIVMFVFFFVHLYHRRSAALPPLSWFPTTLVCKEGVIVGGHVPQSSVGFLGLSPQLACNSASRYPVHRD